MDLVWIPGKQFATWQEWRLSPLLHFPDVAVGVWMCHALVRDLVSIPGKGFATSDKNGLVISLASSAGVA